MHFGIQSAHKVIHRDPKIQRAIHAVISLSEFGHSVGAHSGLNIEYVCCQIHKHAEIHVTENSCFWWCSPFNLSGALETNFAAL